ncbi:MAG: DUF4864 domain-containing protein [Actinobacteria bacterium]|nr:DUF4864 domain-containing protein [Actinomycetota bacterium]
MALSLLISARLLIAISLGVTRCSTNPEPDDETRLEATGCSQEEISAGSAWITGQFNAFGNSEIKATYGFASEQFRSGASLEEFASVVSGQYSALLNLGSYEIGRCDLIEGGFVFQVDLVDDQRQNFTMQYVLSSIAGQRGVDDATIAEKAKDLRFDSATRNS